MSDFSIAQSLLAFGTGIATFLAAWVALFKPLRRKMDEPAGEVALLRQRIDALEKKTEKMDEKVSKAVLDEEFAAYSSHTTQAVTGLTEKVGRVTGAIEAWQQTRR